MSGLNDRCPCCHVLLANSTRRVVILKSVAVAYCKTCYSQFFGDDEE